MCSTRIICRCFWNIFNIDQQNILEAQISEHNKNLSTTPNAHDTSHITTNPTPTATQLQH